MRPERSAGGCLVAQSYPTLATPWTAARQAPLPIGFPWQEHWSGFPFPSPGHLPDLGIEPRSPALQADSLPTELQGKPQRRPETKSARTQSHSNKLGLG